MDRDPGIRDWNPYSQFIVISLKSSRKKLTYLSVTYFTVNLCQWTKMYNCTCLYITAVGYKQRSTETMRFSLYGYSLFRLWFSSLSGNSLLTSFH